MPTHIDLLIEPSWIIPIEPFGEVLTDHALAIDSGRIVALLPTQQAAMRYSAREHLRLPGKVLLPGFVNAHTHAAMTLLRGYADDLPLMRWLQERIWPAENKLLSPRFVRDGTYLAAWEMLRGGVTCFNDMYFFPAAAAQAVQEAGIRAVLGVTVIEFASKYATDADDYLAKGLAARDTCRDEPLLSFALAPHAPYTVSDRSFERIATLAAQLDLPIHVHVHETQHEIEESLKQYGVRPLERLHRLGLLGPNLIGVHAVHLEAAEIALLAKNDCAIAHCPTSNMKLASGIPPIAQLLSAGVRVSLGTDGSASNNRLDILREMRHAALLAKVANGDATTLPAHQALRMATLEGAQALGLGNATGTLEAGKWADLCTIDLDDWLCRPCYDPASHIVYVAGREDVSHVWVAGKARIVDRKPVEMLAIADKLAESANSWQNSR